MIEDEENFLEVLLLNDKTGEPFSKDDNSFFLSKSEYIFLRDQAELSGITLEEQLQKSIHMGLEALTRRYSPSRLTVSETGGAQRSYSYDLDYYVPRGTFSPQELPKELIGEVEGLGQNDSVPSFLRKPDGRLNFKVEEK